MTTTTSTNMQKLNGMPVDEDQSASHLLRRKPFNPILLAANVKLQRPLSRRGKGPGILILRPHQKSKFPTPKKTLDPEPLQKWAEEGFAVVEVTIGDVASLPGQDVLNDVQAACERGITALRELSECTLDEKIGVIGRSEPENVMRGLSNCPFYYQANATGLSCERPSSL